MQVPIEAAQSGDGFVIVRDAVHVSTLVPMAANSKFKLGIVAEKDLGDGPDFFEPMSGEDLQLREGNS